VTLRNLGQTIFYQQPAELTSRSLKVAAFLLLLLEADTILHVVEPSYFPYLDLQLQNGDFHGTSMAGRSLASVPPICAELRLFVNPSAAPLNFRHDGTVGHQVFY
jgi:hypothetical protein